ncbi:MAG: PfkB family carbohydrate kinase [Elusimicrobiota bacterium]|nr:PfkB family carbohydrate kinase [Elusimicrobiota bacterium]
MSDILVVGSVALDSVKTTAGKSVEALGGSATYFALAASYFSPVSLVGVVGEDFPREHRRTLERRGVELSGLKAAKGKTFRWAGKYGKDAAVAETLATHLNVFKEFKPVLSAAQRKMPVAFLANIDPDLQAAVLAQMQGPALVACDTMNYWIDSKPAAIKKLLGKVDVFFSNDQESMKLTGAPNALQAAEILADWGPSVVVIKKGEHGALMKVGSKFFVFPAYPLSRIKDPTGAGDTFAGGFLGYLASTDSVKDISHLKRAMAYGTTMASFNVQDFSTKNIEDLEREVIDERFHDFAERMTVPRADELLKNRRAVPA